MSNKHYIKRMRRLRRRHKPADIPLKDLLAAKRAAAKLQKKS